MKPEALFILFAQHAAQLSEQLGLFVDEPAFDADADQVAEAFQDVFRTLIFHVETVADDLLPQALTALDASSDLHDHLVVFLQQAPQQPAHILQA